MFVKQMIRLSRDHLEKTEKKLPTQTVREQIGLFFHSRHGRRLTYRKQCLYGKVFGKE